MNFSARKTRFNIILVLIAAAMIASGIYLSTHSRSANRDDVTWYNKGVETYNLPGELLPATDDRPSEYPVVRAASYFQEAASISMDDELKALALYNLGTMMGAEGLTYFSGETPMFGVSEAINKLIESIRLDPSNEGAKYNLELFEKALAILQPSGGSAVAEKVTGSMGGLAGYSSGTIYKGY